MAVNDAGEVAGSVSGGCVEGAVVAEALEVLAGERERGRHHVRLLRRRGVRGRPHLRRHDPPLRRAPRLVAQPMAERHVYEALRDALRDERAGRARDGHRRARASAPSCSSRPDGDRARHARRPRPRPGRRARRARRARGRAHVDPALRRARRSARRHASSVFIESFAPPPRMIIFGAVDFTAALAQRRQGARLPRHRVRRPRRVRHACSASRWPTRS